MATAKQHDPSSNENIRDNPKCFSDSQDQSTATHLIAGSDDRAVQQIQFQ
jgi:hypothetical protein